MTPPAGTAAGNYVQYLPAFMDGYQAASLAIYNGYSNSSGGKAEANNFGHLRVQGRQKLRLRLGSAPNQNDYSYAIADCIVDAYLCMPRRNISNAGNTSANAVNAFLSFNETQADVSNILGRIPGVTPYMNTSFVEQYRILKRRRIRLTVQRPERVLSLKRSFDFDYAKWVVNPDTTRMPGMTLEWLLIVRGSLGRSNQTFAGAGVVADQVGIPATVLLYQSTTTLKWIPLVQTGKPYSFVAYSKLPADPTGNGQYFTHNSMSAASGVGVVA